MGVKYKGSKAMNKPIKSRMMDDNFEASFECPIISQKAKESDIWLYLTVVSGAIALAVIGYSIYLLNQ